MRIGICGTHCSGKTSLISALRNVSNFANYSFFTEPIRIVSNYGFKINKEADDASQIAMLAIHLKNLTYDNFIADRSLLDLYVYSLSLDNISKYVVDFLRKAWQENADKYDYLYICNPEFNLVSDGFRSSDIKWQQDIDNLFNAELASITSNNVLKHCKIKKISGQTLDRCAMICEEVLENAPR